MEIDGIRGYASVMKAPQPLKSPEKQQTQDLSNSEQTQTVSIEKASESESQNYKKPSKDKEGNREDEASSKMLNAAIESANKQLKNANRMIRASVHEKTNRMLVKVIDTETDEVIREIPPEKTLDMFAKMLEMAGILLDEKK